MNLGEIKNDLDIQSYLGTSGMKYNNKGQMYFNDDIYFTHWSVDAIKLSSETLFNSLGREGFEAPMALFSKGMDWNLFGFLQNFKDSITGNVATPLHRNMHLELYYVVKGHFELRVQNEVLHLSEGELVLLNSNALHSDSFSSEAMELVIMGLNESYFDEDFHKYIENIELSNFIKNSFNPSYKNANYWTFKPVDRLSILDTSTYRIQQELRHRSIHYEKMIQVYLTRLFKSLGHDFKIQEYESEGHGLRAILFTEVQRYIESHYANVTLDDLAMYLKYSRDYLSRLIKELTGLSYIQYLQKIRVEKAMDLLDSTEMSVNEIAEQVGYQNNSHFYDIFKNIAHQTPNEYRNMRHKVNK